MFVNKFSFIPLTVKMFFDSIHAKVSLVKPDLHRVLTHRIRTYLRRFTMISRILITTTM